MAAGAWTFYKRAKRNMFTSSLQATSSYRLSLYLSTSNAATTTFSTLASITNEVVSVAASYSTSGKAMTGVTWTAGASAGIIRFTSSAVFFSANAQITGVKFAVIWVTGASATARKLLCFSQLSTANFNITAGNRLTITPSATGIFQLS